MSVHDKIIELVERFERNIDAYKQGKYKETQVRREFIDPFFKALGWDVDNERGYAEAYKEVVHEDAIKVGWGTKAPDYSFRIGGTRKFFIEAKKPSVDIKGDIHPAFQLRRYAWSAKLPLSILTDFEEFAVYDTRIKPNKNDKASNARVMYMTFRDYPEKWEEIASVFSHDSILKGSFDKYVESGRKKRGTAEVDDAFLSEIESWRDLLARNIALRNTQLENRVLNDVVQKTIDRILFLRICEDRGVENYGQLMALLNGVNIYSRLSKLFLKADERYNSGLFHFSSEKNRQDPDEISLQLAIDDKHLKDIIKRLYYPESPYEFSVLPADILGQVYERFLGKVIRRTPGHRAVVEEKPEVRKAGGVYYTPTYIVDYIVKNTVGKLLEGKTPKQVEKLKILDPACGSGSFLLGAYQYLMDWHLKEYTAEDPEKYMKSRSPKIYQIRSGDWRLSTTEKKRILLNNIYGVDIDTQAVEVTKLSLLLKVLEGETDETLKSQLKLFHERALPDLGNNIKCGNSLIGSDFYEGRQLSILTEDEMYRINAFDWEKEFPEIMKNGGFDAVIGNPPYVRGRSLDAKLKDFLLASISTFTPNADLYVAFLGRGFDLLKSGGSISFIIPRSFLIETYAQKLRMKFLQSARISEILDFQGIKVFENATVTNIIINLHKESPSDVVPIRHWKEETHNFLLVVKILKNQDVAIRPELTGHHADLIEKVGNTEVKVNDLCYVSYSVAAHSEVEGKKKDAYIFGDKKNAKCKQFIEAREIARYKIGYLGRWLEYDPKIVRRPGLPELFNAPKIMVRDVVGQQGLICAYDDSGLYADYSVVCLTLKSNLQKVTSRKLIWTDKEIDLSKKYSIFYVLGIINSRLLNFFFKTSIGGGLHVYPDNIRQLPIRPINFAHPTEKATHDRIVLLVDQMLDLNKRLSSAQTQHEKTLLQRQIEATDRQIDKLVYELYDLTEEEIKMVEQS